MKQSMPESVLCNSASDSDGPLIDDNVIRIQLRKPRNRKWELSTRNCSPGRAFPTIQLFDCEGNLLVETNDDNLSIRSADYDSSQPGKRYTKSFGATDFLRRRVNFPVKKNNSISGDKIYTRFYRRSISKEEKKIQRENLERWTDSNLPCCDDQGDGSAMEEYEQNLRIPKYRRSSVSPQDSFTSALSIMETSEIDISSFKSSDNESSAPQSTVYNYVTGKPGTLLLCESDSTKYPDRRKRPVSRHTTNPDSLTDNKYKLNQSKGSHSSIPNLSDGQRKLYSYNGMPLSRKSSLYTDYPSTSKKYPSRVRKSASYYYKPPSKRYGGTLRRANTDINSADKNQIKPLPNSELIRKMSFLDIYLKSLPSRNKEIPAWLEEIANTVKLREKSKTCYNEDWRKGMILSDESSNFVDQVPTYDDDDVESAVEHEIKRRLRKYQKVLSCSDYWTWKEESTPKEVDTRRYSEGNVSSSSESLDEADKVLMRLRRRIFQNKKRERREVKHDLNDPQDFTQHTSQAACLPAGAGRDGRLVSAAAAAMGASVGRHGPLRGRRAQSSGDLCAAERPQDACSVSGGSTVGDASTWNRSLPSHLDFRRRCPCGDCGPSDNNNCPPPRLGPPFPRHHRKYSHHYACKSAPDLEPVWKLQDPGCDQGYGSERSPEEEFPPALPPEDDFPHQLDIRQMYPFISDENTFTVRVEKDRRGLGLSVAGGAGSAGGAGLVRIRRLYASQPAWSTGRLRPGDLLLAANGVSLAGLTTYEALEVLRTTPPVVELVVCRPDPAQVAECVTPPGAPPSPPLRRAPPAPPDPLNRHAPRPRAPAPSPPPDQDYEEPTPIFDVKFGEFDIVMTKVNGSLGFTLRKEDHSALGHYVRALVREPALSDGRIQPGDRIVAVNDVPMSTLSHGEAVSFLRRCGPMARLRLYRDHCGTPPSPSAASPTTESDTTLTRPKPPLRQEAVNMLCDIAARKLTPEDGNGSRSPCVSPRRYKKLTRNSTGYSQNSDTMHPYSVNCPSTTAENSDNEMSQTLSYQSTDTADTTYSVVPEGRPIRPTCFNGQSFDNSKPARPDFLDLGGPPTPVNNRKQRLHFSVAAHGYELNNLDNDVLDAPNIYQDITQNGGTAYLSSQNHQLGSEMSNEPISMPIELNATANGDEVRFNHKNPAYQSAVVHPSTNNHSSSTSALDTSKDEGVKKWKCLPLSSENDRKLKKDASAKEEPEKPKIVHYADENKEPGNSEPRILTVELNRGWNSRLGFSVQCHPDSGQSFISAIYSDSVAAKDGRLRQGDIILQVNDENITSMTTPQVIDLLRILRGSICITVLRQ